jgi:hypothetical protein
MLCRRGWASSRAAEQGGRARGQGDVSSLGIRASAEDEGLGVWSVGGPLAVKWRCGFEGGWANPMGLSKDLGD